MFRFIITTNKSHNIDIEKLILQLKQFFFKFQF